MIQDFPSQSDRPGEAITFVLVTPKENIWLKHLAIKTIPDHATARKIIADAYSEISGEEVTDIMHFGYASSYVMEVHKGNISEEKAIVVLMRTMMILVILMTMLGLTGMSVYFASERRPEIAIRKIFGGTIETETVRNIKAYMKIILIADIIAMPLIYLLLSQLSSNSVVKVGNTFWIYASAIAMSFVIAILAVLWQTLRAARINPAEALKKE
jgi:putative ABC transport system permease protein